jgi:hypothetical protein
VFCSLRYNAPKLLSAGNLDAGTSLCGRCEGCCSTPAEQHPSHRPHKQVPASRLPADYNLGALYLKLQNTFSAPEDGQIIAQNMLS